MAETETIVIVGDPATLTNGDLSINDDLPIASTTDPSRIINSDDYELYENVPVFIEHTRALKSGRELKFGRYELERVIERSNRRIEETGDFAPIVIGHTSPDPNAPKPPKIGWAGPFKLGWLTEARDKLAILADFRIDKDKTSLLNEYPRRSAELWAEDRYEDMYLDPISLLGADTPWGDMGVLYRKDGRAGIEKIYYSIMPQAPGAYNCGGFPNCIGDQKKTKDEKERYSMYGDEMESLSGDQKAIAQTIVNAIFDSPEFQFLRREMNKGGASDDTPQRVEPVPDGAPVGGTPISDAPDEEPEQYSAIAPGAADAQIETPEAPDSPELYSANAAQQDEDEEEEEPVEEPSDEEPEEDGDLPLDTDQDDVSTEIEDLPEDMDDEGGDLGYDDLEPVDEDFSEPLPEDEEPIGNEPTGQASLLNEEPDDYAPEDDYGVDDYDEPPYDEEPLDDYDELDNEDDFNLYDDEPVDDYGLENEAEEDEVMNLRERVAQLEKRLNLMAKAFDYTTDKVVSKERYSKLSALRKNFVFDENAEREKCCYKKMTDAQFNARVNEIQKNYRRTPDKIDLPNGLVARAPDYLAERPGAVQYSKERDAEFERRVAERAEANAARGVYQSAEEIRNELSANRK